MVSLSVLGLPLSASWRVCLRRRPPPPPPNVTPGEDIAFCLVFSVIFNSLPLVILHLDSPLSWGLGPTLEDREATAAGQDRMGGRGAIIGSGGWGRVEREESVKGRERESERETGAEPGGGGGGGGLRGKGKRTGDETEINGRRGRERVCESRGDIRERGEKNYLFERQLWKPEWRGQVGRWLRKRGGERSLAGKKHPRGERIGRRGHGSRERERETERGRRQGERRQKGRFGTRWVAGGTGRGPGSSRTEEVKEGGGTSSTSAERER